MARIAEVDGKHRLVVFGRPARRLPVVSRYTDALDREARLRAKVGESGPDAGRAGETYYLKADHEDRLTVDEMVEVLSAYDVISFDIFDTALYRSVEFPKDVLRIMGSRLGDDSFARLRKNAESHARAENKRQKGSREVTLREIYAVMGERYGADPAWEELERSLEIELSRPNPYILEVYGRLKDAGKKLVFMTDMYLPRDVIEKMLAQSGYDGYEKIYLSNEHLRRKGDGTLQLVLLDDYAGEHSVVHVGDVLEADVQKSEEVGLPAVFNPDPRGIAREPDMASLAGSFYGAVLNNTLGSGTWTEGLHYTHGFRVGGILALGYLEHLETLVREKGIDKILFCGRDCDVLSQAYQRFYGETESVYLDVSRYALSGVTLDRNFEDYISRSFFRWFKESNNTKTLEQLLTETGFDYLVPYLEGSDVDRFLFPSSTNRRRIERFLWDHKAVVEEHNRTSLAAAKAYFSTAVGDAERVLVVDIGWNGSSMATLRHFFKTALPERDIEVFGAVMCASRTEQLIDAVSSGRLSSYVYSPLANVDLTKFMMPGGRQSVRTTDLLHLPLEFLFTEAVASVVGYAFDPDGRPVPVRGNNLPQNVDQIMEMQRGIIDFIETYLDYSRGYEDVRPVSPYVAFNPLRRAIRRESYSYRVYKDFLYDATPALFGEETHTERFGELFESDADGLTGALAAPGGRGTAPQRGRRILFISPEMIYAGAPRSLLRMCKVVAESGYEPIVWTAKAGPFAKEFEALGIPVKVVRPTADRSRRLIDLLPEGVDLVVCNTVMTDAYVRAFEGRVPLVWYIREATNLPDFFRSSPERMRTVRQSRSICVVSEYAAAAVAKHADGPIQVVHNSVEDVSNLAASYEPRSGGKHRFVQLGTIEHRKGYDLLVAAYKSLPKDYRDRSELHFAGGFINSGTSFASYLFGQVDGEEGIFFHGLISDERKKIELLSRMDTVVVASRDESFSLVALEGAMLSKPLVVTENVGASYLVDDSNGLVVESGSVAAVRDALISMMDRDEETLREMGAASRWAYAERASMAVYRRDLGALFERRIAAGPVRRLGRGAIGRSLSTGGDSHGRASRLIVSLTSIPTRLQTLGACIDSLLDQTMVPDEVILWLSTENFPGRTKDLPADLLAREGGRFRIAWVEGDLAPHKKYFYAMQEYPDALVITVDDDVVYGRGLVENLYRGHLENPHAVITERANLIMFRPDGSLREYDAWVYDCQHLRGTATYQLLPTGIAGVLYPPGALPPAAFDIPAIEHTSLRNDDLWLKAMTTANGYPVWMPRTPSGFEPIEEAQAVGLWRSNSFHGGNDGALRRVLEHYDLELGSSDALLKRIQGVGDDGRMVGPDEIDLTPLIDTDDTHLPTGARTELMRS